MPSQNSGMTSIKLSIAAVSASPSIGIASPELTLHHMMPHTNRRNRMSTFHLPCIFVADLSRQEKNLKMMVDVIRIWSLRSPTLVFNVRLVRIVQRPFNTAPNLTSTDVDLQTNVNTPLHGAFRCNCYSAAFRLRMRIWRLLV